MICALEGLINMSWYAIFFALLILLQDWKRIISIFFVIISCAIAVQYNCVGSDGFIGWIGSL
jgi:hypothetical protein